MRELVFLQCSKCKRLNYSATKNKQLNKDKLEIKKYCKFCRSHTSHIEKKKK